MNDLGGKSILVTGGSGFIGRALTRGLVDRGARVFVLTRRAGLDLSGVSCISSLSQISDAAVDVIINLAGEPIAQRWTAAAKQKIRSSRIDTTATLIQFIQSRTVKPALFISGSAIGYYGTDEEREFDEAAAPVASSPFARGLCADWEAEAKKAEGFGVRTVHLRTGAVLGKEGGMLGKLLLPFRLGLGGPIGDGRQWLSWIDRDDLIGLIFHIMDDAAITGPINATAPAPVSNEVFSKTLADVLGRPCLLRTPPFVLRTLFGAMADEIMIKGQKVLPRKALATGFTFSYPTIRSSLEKILKSDG